MKNPSTEGLARLLWRQLATVEAGRMDIHKMIAELRADLAALEELIAAAERYAAGGKKRRGRPPKWMAATRTVDVRTVPRKRRPFSAETRRRMATSQRRRWKAERTAREAIERATGAS